ncbi:MAG: hypothetical protein IJ174_08055 [Clostridia bacterium]|nr:hypothetical protein [Clostridia bacterium]
MNTLIIVGEQDAGAYEQALSGSGLAVAAFPCADWNRDLSPWPAEKAFKKGEPFAGEAAAYLNTLLAFSTEWERSLPEPIDKRYLAGYSLAGLFSLWALYETERFDGAVSASGSLWYPGWLDFISKNHPKRPARFSLSLGDKEVHTKNPVMARVGDATRETCRLLDAQGYPVAFAWNEGGHFADEASRVVRAVRALLELG